MDFLIVGTGFLIFALAVFAWAHTKSGKKILEE